MIQTLNSVGETIHVSPVDVFNIVLCASNKGDDKDVVKKMYNWWRGVFEVLSKCDVPDDRKKEYDDLVDALMVEISKTGNDAQINESEEYGYEQADIEDENVMLKDMKFAISKIGEIANRVQDLINFVNPYCQSFNEDKIMKFKKINESVKMNDDEVREFVKSIGFLPDSDGIDYETQLVDALTGKDTSYNAGWGAVYYNSDKVLPYLKKYGMLGSRGIKQKDAISKLRRLFKSGKWKSPQQDELFNEYKNMKFKKINENGGEFVPPEVFECDGVEYKIEPEKNPTFPEGDYAILEWEDGEYKYKCRHMGAYDVKMWMNNMRKDENRRREERILRQRYKKNESKDDEWVDMDDLIGVPQSDPRDDIKIPKRLQKADESNVVVDVNDVWELLKVLEDDEASSNLKSLIDSHVRTGEEIMDVIDELYPEDVTQIELNNVFATGMEEIVDALGLDVEAYMKDGSFVDTLKPSTIAAEGDEESNQDEVKDGEKKFKGDDGEVKTLDNADKKVVSEMTIEQEIDDPWKLSEMMWGQGHENLQELLRSDVVDEEEVMQMIEDMGIRDLTGINDVFAFEFREILESLGLDGKAWSNNLEIKRKDDDDEVDS